MSIVSHLHHFFHAETCQSFYVAVLVKLFLSSLWSDVVIFPLEYLRLRRPATCAKCFQRDYAAHASAWSSDS
jgi:hypothetical protein